MRVGCGKDRNNYFPVYFLYFPNPSQQNCDFSDVLVMSGENAVLEGSKNIFGGSVETVK